MSTLELVEEWQRRADPAPTARSFDVALGCHVEEFEELLEQVEMDAAHEQYKRELCSMLKFVATALKTGTGWAAVKDRKEFLDGLADGVVTAVGVGYRARMSVPKATMMVNLSNWSKFVNDQPVYDENGKVKKGPGYKPPVLEGLY